MSSPAATTSKEFFEQKYRQASDPWNFAGSAYELGRYSAIMTALGGRRYARAFEPGCSIGVLTAQLAFICAQLVAMDLSETAIEHARERCRALPNVHFRVGSVADAPLEGVFDLIVLSEIGYYFRESDLQALTSRLIHHLQPGGVLLAVHWLGVSPDHLRSGDEVHQTLRSVANEAGLQLEQELRTEGFRMDRWTRG